MVVSTGLRWGPASFADNWRIRFPAEFERKLNAMKMDDRNAFVNAYKLTIQSAIERRSAKWDGVAYTLMGRQYTVQRNGLDEIYQLDVSGAEIVINDDGDTAIEPTVLVPPVEGPAEIQGSW